MSIKNKDGTVFRLRGPNPLMKKQKNWEEEEEFVLHNCEWDNETRQDEGDVVTDQSDFNVKSDVSLEEPIELEPPEPEPEPEPEPPKPYEPQKTFQLENKIKIHCLPLVTIEHHDELYNEVRKSQQYGAKFLFEGIIINQNDFSLIFWSDIKTIEAGSIVYPQTKEKRWWKVTKKEPKGWGYVFTTMPSDIQPDFS